MMFYLNVDLFLTCFFISSVWIITMIGSFLSCVDSGVGLDVSSTVIRSFRYHTRTMMSSVLWNSWSTYCFSFSLKFYSRPWSLRPRQNNLLFPWSFKFMTCMLVGWSARLILHILGDRFFLHNRLGLIIRVHCLYLICSWFCGLGYFLRHLPRHCFPRLVGPFLFLESWGFLSKQCWTHTLILVLCGT